MKKIVAGISLLIIVITNSGCPKPCIEANYSFAVNAQINPNIDSVHVGDTIFLTSTFSSKLKDLVSGDSINYSNSTAIGSTLAFVKLIKGVDTVQETVPNFNFVSIIGRIYNDNSIPSPKRVQQLTYQGDNNNYKIKIGIIPKQTGIYSLGLSDGLSTGRKNSNSCEKAGFSITLNNTNQHLNYFSEWNPNNNLSIYQQQRVYFLKVY